jgi:hypothetical protein
MTFWPSQWLFAAATPVPYKAAQSLNPVILAAAGKSDRDAQ